MATTISRFSDPWFVTGLALGVLLMILDRFALLRFGSVMLLKSASSERGRGSFAVDDVKARSGWLLRL